jgi:predicted RNA-binding protein
MCPVHEEFKKITCPAGVYKKKKCKCSVHEEFKKSTCPADVYKNKKCMCPVHEEFKKSTCPAGVYKKKNVCAQFMRIKKNLLALREYTRKKMYVPSS